MATQSMLIVGVGGTGQQVLYHTKRNLLNTYGNVPQSVQLLCLDTNMESDYPSMLRDEHIFIGGDANNYARKVEEAAKGLASGRGYDCVAEWHDAGYYMSTSASRELYNLRIGAGASRQLGRLSLFYDLSQGGTSRLLNALQAAISDIRSMGHTHFHAAVTGSLVGGTGSGIFLDVAYLIGAIAQAMGISARVRGYFVLPEAFFENALAGAPNIARRERLLSAFAAMREAGRFSSDFHYEQGIPMYYCCDAVDDIVHGHARYTLFDQLYYLDGWRQRNPLLRVPIANGIAPTIADVLTTMVDDTSGSTLQQHAANVSAFKHSVYGAQVRRDVATVGSVGSYSFVLPIERMRASASARLLKNALSLLLAPTYRNGDDANASELVPGAGSKDGAAWWERPEGDPLMKELGSIIGAKATSGHQGMMNTIRDLKDRPVGRWINPVAAAVPDRELNKTLRLALRVELEKVLWPIWGRGWVPAKKPNPFAQVLTSIQTRHPIERKNPAAGAERVRYSTEQLRLTLCGDSGSYVNSLQSLAHQHEQAFRDDLLSFVVKTLNGKAQNTVPNAVRNRAGKLGYLQAFLLTLGEHLDATQHAVAEARVLHRAEMRYVDLTKQREVLSEQMQQAVRYQERYLEVSHRLLRTDQWDVTARIVEESAARCRDFIQHIVENIQQWADALAMGEQSALTQVRASLHKIDLERTQDDDLDTVRHVINDAAYEEDQFRRYARSGQDEDEIYRMLRDFMWDIGQEEEVNPITGATVGQRPVLRLTLRGAGVGPDPDAELKIEQTSDNYEALQRRANRVFDHMHSEESICRYLMLKYGWRDSPDPDANSGPRNIADQMYSLAAPLLRHDAHNAVPFNYLVLNVDPNDATQVGFVNSIRAQLAANAGVPPNQAPQFVSATNPFRMTLLAFDEVIDVEKVASYDEGRKVYHGKLEGGLVQETKLHHVFAAERNTVYYEALMAPGTLLPPRIRMLLSDSVRFQTSANCWLYGHGTADLLHLHSYNDSATQKSLWTLSIQPLPGERDARGMEMPAAHYGLTDPDAGTPDILVAFENFILNGNAKWFWTGADGVPTDTRDNPRSLPFDLLSGVETNRIAVRMRADMEDRVRRGDLGRLAPMLASPLTHLSGAKLDTYRYLLYQFERLGEGELSAASKYEGLMRDHDPAMPIPPQAYLYQLLRAHFIQERTNLKRTQMDMYLEDASPS